MPVGIDDAPHPDAVEAGRRTPLQRAAPVQGRLLVFSLPAAGLRESIERGKTECAESCLSTGHCCSQAGAPRLKLVDTKAGVGHERRPADGGRRRGWWSRRCCRTYVSSDSLEEATNVRGMREGIDHVTMVLEQDGFKQPPRFLLVALEVQDLAQVHARPLSESFVVHPGITYKAGQDAFGVVVRSSNRLVELVLWGGGEVASEARILSVRRSGKHPDEKQQQCSDSRLHHAPKATPGLREEQAATIGLR